MKYVGGIVSAFVVAGVLAPLSSGAGSVSAASAQTREEPRGSESAPAELSAIDLASESETSTDMGAKPNASAVAPTSCPSDMVEIEGDYCPVVEQYCLRAVDPKHVDHDRCAEFAETGRCFGRPQRKHFCIDKYEWPNREGEKPVVAVDWMEAREACSAAGKRLCMDNEWTLACEGQERLPYPYGYSRNAEACNIDRHYILPNEPKIANPKTREEELRRLDQREPSGAREACVSPYGVHDMTGNVDEWVLNDSGHTMEKPYFTGLKGGYWGPVRDRCRPMTTDHNDQHIGYQIGFRCCGDLPDTTGVAARTRVHIDPSRQAAAATRSASN